MTSEPPKSFGEFPPCLYRTFDREEYALDFIEKGIIRFGLLNFYAEVEDTIRKDSTEGTGLICAPDVVTKVALDKNGNPTKTWEELGKVRIHSEFVNAIYILCCSYPPHGNQELLPKKFGEFTVKINQPEQFGNELTRKLWNGPNEYAAVVECSKVSYNKGETIEKKLTNQERQRLSYSQKYKKDFSDEHEYRYVFLSGIVEEAEPFHFVNLGGPLSYAEMI